MAPEPSTPALELLLEFLAAQRPLSRSGVQLPEVFSIYSPKIIARDPAQDVATYCHGDLLESADGFDQRMASSCSSFQGWLLGP